MSEIAAGRYANAGEALGLGFREGERKEKAAARIRSGGCFSPPRTGGVAASFVWVLIA